MLKSIFYSLLFFSFFLIGCDKDDEKPFLTLPDITGTGAASFRSGDVIVTGDYIFGKPLTSSSFIDIPVSFSQMGTVSVISDEVNGVHFGDTTEVLSLNDTAYMMRLRGYGTPVDMGTFTYTVTLNGESKTFAIGFDGWKFTVDGNTIMGGLQGEKDASDAFSGYPDSLIHIYGNMSYAPVNGTALDLLIMYPESPDDPAIGPKIFNTSNSSDYEAGISYFFISEFDGIFNGGVSGWLDGSAYSNWLADVYVATQDYPDVNLKIEITSYDHTTGLMEGKVTGTAFDADGNVVQFTDGVLRLHVSEAVH